ncbi:MAG: hypothetical protein LCI00_19265 [Chloroflexi bacterium]|nr:hypothetical protein [Chloroflexota bacterium]MCC6894137.1 hypothetical protein [Anaerolineae bacterium]
MPTTWTVAIDWDRNDNFTGTYDDLTSRIVSANWYLGFRENYQDMAGDGVLKLVLTNVDKRYSPENSLSPLFGKLVPYRPVRVQSNDGTLRTHWTGWIESIEPKVNQYGERTVEIKAAGPGLFFNDAQTGLEVQENKRTDQIIDLLLEEVIIPPALTASTLLDEVGYAEVGVSAFLANTVIGHTLQTGKTTLAYAADNWVRQSSPTDQQEKDTFNVYRAIKDVVAAERGRFFFDRGGQAVFWNRHHLLTQSTVAATFDNSMNGLDYEYAGLGEFKNEVVVTCSPRTVSPATTDLLWKLDTPISIPQGRTKRVTASYTDGSNNRIGGKNVTIANLVVSQGQASVRLVAGGSRATLDITNGGAGEAIISSCELRGKKITSFGRMEATAQDNRSIAYYGRRTLNMNLPSIDNLEFAQDIADFEMGRRSQPSGKVKTMTLVSDGVQGGGPHTQQLTRTLGDLIRVKEAQTAHDDTYFIIGEEHRLTKRGELLETTWYLEPATDANWFNVGISKLNEGLLAY